MKLLTDFDGHPDVLAVGLSGAGLFARSLAYAGKYETDGEIPSEWLESVLASAKQELSKSQALATALVKQGLWETTDNGYRICDFTEVNYSREDMERLRKTRSRAGKRGGKAKASKSQARAKANAKQNNSYSSSNSSSSSFSQEFKEWIEDYNALTGREIKGSSPDLAAFNARRKEGHTLDDLKAASRGCHGSEFNRENGHDYPKTILQPSKVEKYIGLGRKAGKPRTDAGLDRLLDRDA